MKGITGFFMAWGMFLAIPCPVRRWDEASRQHMIACFPLIGGIIGGLWVLLAWLVTPLPAAARAFILAIWPWICTGFMHLDGYMDVCDAVLSRRDLETRQRILKDSHCGAFAVIGLVLLVLGQWSVLLHVERLPWLVLLCVPVASRSCAAIAVLTLRPMGTSQYAAMKRNNVFLLLPILCLAASTVVPAVWGGNFAPLATAAAYWLFAFYGYRQLDGMNGDISGFALTLAEMAGVAVLTLAG